MTGFLFQITFVETAFENIFEGSQPLVRDETMSMPGNSRVCRPGVK